jgi:hypothetical protein
MMMMMIMTMMMMITVICVEINTVGYLKFSVFWDITPCIPLKANRRFGGTCCLHLQNQRISYACCLLYAGILIGLFYDPKDEGGMFLRKFG